ncbi:hypothetical protein [Mesorhizobium sp.]|uniref:hypothetical protein n=1 Tax=Mesorhizobium sp. TaxID=1871066 RepID=UPI0025C5938B|nr:hypothetical protein [Mesorhizobium sp.]
MAASLFVSERPFGGYAEYVTINAGLATPLPEALSFEEATALMVQGLTAFHLLRQSRQRASRSWFPPPEAALVRCWCNWRKSRAPAA